MNSTHAKEKDMLKGPLEKVLVVLTLNACFVGMLTAQFIRFERGASPLAALLGCLAVYVLYFLYAHRCMFVYTQTPPAFFPFCAVDKEDFEDLLKENNMTLEDLEEKFWWFFAAPPLCFALIYFIATRAS